MSPSSGEGGDSLKAELELSLLLAEQLELLLSRQLGEKGGQEVGRRAAAAGHPVLRATNPHSCHLHKEEGKSFGTYGCIKNINICIRNNYLWFRVTGSLAVPYRT